MIGADPILPPYISALILQQPSLSSFCLIWNDISTIGTFLVTDIP